MRGGSFRSMPFALPSSIILESIFVPNMGGIFFVSLFFVFVFLSTDLPRHMSVALLTIKNVQAELGRFLAPSSW